MTKPEGRGSLLQRSFRRSFRRTKKDEVLAERKSAEQAEEEEQKLITELRNAVAGVIHEDRHGENFLRRCLKGKNMDVKEAEQLIRLTVNYQKMLRTEEIEKELKIIQIDKGLIGTGFLGFDKEGAPVRALNMGRIDLKGVIHTTSTIDLVKLIVYFFEKDEIAMKAENEKTGKKAYQCVHVIDMDELSTAQAMYKPLIDTSFVGLKLLQEYYNQFIKCIVIINAPAIFSTLYKMLKPAIGEDLQKRIKIFGRDEWKEPLLEMVDADILPKSLGGNRVDKKGDPRCSELYVYAESMVARSTPAYGKVGQGGVVPEEYYIKDNLLDTEMPDVVSLTIPAASCINIPYDVPEAGTILKWHIQSKDNDIGIGLYIGEIDDQEPAQNDPEDLIVTKKADQKALLDQFEQLTPIIRSQCHLVPEIGHIKAWKAARYVLHLDNTYSWMSPKQVLFKIELIPPSEQFESIDQKLIDSITNL